MLLEEYPVVTILGPRQSGKTTLARHYLADFHYRNLGLPDVREFADADPKGFLADAGEPLIIDEIQRVPKLLGYIQSLVDENKNTGRFVITGSHQLQEIDLLFKRGDRQIGVEIKSSATLQTSFIKSLNSIGEKVLPLDEKHLVYSGDETRRYSSGVMARNFKSTFEIVTGEQ